MTIKAVFFDVANTLLHKPNLYSAIHRVLSSHAIFVPLRKIVLNHKLLSEAISFPDKTSKSFYQEFNRRLVNSFGVLASDDLVDEIFDSCTYLPWHPFEDVDALNRLSAKIGILSNWDNTLQDKLTLMPAIKFDWVFGSEEQQMSKPNPLFFKKAATAAELAPDEIMYVGDSMRLDIEPASNLGIHTVLLDRDDAYPSATVTRINSLYHLPDILRQVGSKRQ